jgi:hypothetical protein
VLLSDDQKAILRLLAQRGEQGYEDLSALMGISVGEVHARARAAAGELEAEGIPAPAIPDPPGGAGEGESPAGNRLGGEFPSGDSPSPSKPQRDKPAQTPEKQEEPKAVPPALPKGEPKPPLKRELKLLEGRGLWALLAGAAIVIVFLVIILVGGGGGSGSDTTPTAPASGSVTDKAVEALENAAAKGGKEVTKAVLNPVDGSEASGVAVFGRVKNKLALQVFAEGLDETGEGEGYTIWLAASESKMLPLASSPVGKSGKISAQVEVPVEILAYLANETFGQIAITRTDESQLRASLAKATKEKQAPVYTGTEVLRGTVTGPIVGAAKRLEEEGKK